MLDYTYNMLDMPFMGLIRMRGEIPCPWAGSSYHSGLSDSIIMSSHSLPSGGYLNKGGTVQEGWWSHTGLPVYSLHNTSLQYIQ